MIKKFHYNAPVVLSYTIFSFIALILGVFTNNSTTHLFFSIYRSPVTNPLLYIRLLGHVLGHADWQHYFNNFIIILLVGPMLEEKYGSKKLLICIIFTAFITGFLNIVFFDTGLLGASGVVFMMIFLSSFVNLRDGKVPLTLILIVIIFIGKEILDGFLVDDNISQLTHIVGGLCGGIAGYTLGNKGSSIRY